jgi:hypothetical protein
VHQSWSYLGTSRIQPIVRHLLADIAFYLLAPFERQELKIAKIYTVRNGYLDASHFVFRYPLETQGPKGNGRAQH